MTQEEKRAVLAAYAHEAWSGWHRYMLSKCEPGPDGTLIIPAWAVMRWQRQMDTPFAELSAKEQESDYVEADRMLSIVEGE